MCILEAIGLLNELISKPKKYRVHPIDQNYNKNKYIFFFKYQDKFKKLLSNQSIVKLTVSLKIMSSVKVDKCILLRFSVFNATHLVKWNLRKIPNTKMTEEILPPSKKKL